MARSQTKSSAKADLTSISVAENGLVQVRLAHPLKKKFGLDLGFTTEDMDKVTEKTKLPVGTLLAVTRAGATSLIGAGHAQVDPEDLPTVDAVLSGAIIGEAGVTAADAPKDAVIVGLGSEPTTTPTQSGADGSGSGAASQS